MYKPLRADYTGRGPDSDLTSCHGCLRSLENSPPKGIAKFVDSPLALLYTGALWLFGSLRATS